MRKTMIHRHIRMCFLLYLNLSIFLTGCSTDSSPNSSIKATATNDAQFNVSIAVNPSLFPSFNRNVSDYVSRCSDGKPVVISVSSPRGTLVSIAGSQYRDGDFEVSISRSAGQSFTISIDANNETFLHHVRCLPLDFQWWTVEKFGDTQSEFYQIMPRRDGPDPKPYPAIFDNNGVPIWWATKAQNSVFAQFLPNGNYGYLNINDTSFTQISLDGNMAREIDLGIVFDHHDSILLPNGNLVMVKNELETGVDLSKWGLSTSESILNHIFLEVDSLNNIVWSWNTFENISPDETDVNRRHPMLNTTHYDPYHFNSIDVHENSYVISFRNLNAVFNINRDTGKIMWKLGGSKRTETLKIINDPTTTKIMLSGQHDARILDDGTLTLHENGSNTDRAPRALRFHIDPEEKTAVLIENLSSRFKQPSSCCGSARKLQGGNWVVGWGGTSLFSELTADGSPVLSLIFLEGVNIYRGLPVPYGQFDRNDLRLGMDNQYPVH